MGNENIVRIENSRLKVALVLLVAIGLAAAFNMASYALLIKS